MSPTEKQKAPSSGIGFPGYVTTLTYPLRTCSRIAQSRCTVKYRLNRVEIGLTWRTPVLPRLGSVGEPGSEDRPCPSWRGDPTQRRRRPHLGWAGPALQRQLRRCSRTGHGAQSVYNSSRAGRYMVPATVSEKRGFQ